MMNNGNGRPLSARRKVQFLVIVTLLFWATQTLVSQWGFGADAPQTAWVTSDAQPAYVPPATSSATGRLEIRAQAQVVGNRITLRQVCQWNEHDAGMFEPIGDLVLAQMPEGRAFVAIDLPMLRQALRDAGVNMARLQLSGAVTCTVTRSDAPALAHTQGLQQWIEAREGAARPDDVPLTLSAAPVDGAPELAADLQPVIEQPAYRTLRQILTDDLARTLNMDPAGLLVEFKVQDETLLRQTEPHFQFQFEPRRGRTLGQVGWEVYITNGADRRRATVTAYARAWQQQLVVSQAVAHRQVIRDEDVIERRTLVDRYEDVTLLSRLQTVGQMAAMELRPGMVVNARMVDAVPLARRGQLITVRVREGNIELKSVGRAMETGSYGQTIRVKNELTGDIHQVVLTGPQTADLSPMADMQPGMVADVGLSH